MGCIAIHTTDWRVGASRAFLASGEGARVLSSRVGTGANGTAGTVSTQRSRMSICLAVVALGAPSVGNVIVQLALPIAHDEVLTADCVLLDISHQRHYSRRGCFMLVTFRGCQPAWRLPLYELRIVGSDAV